MLYTNHDDDNDPFTAPKAVYAHSTVDDSGAIVKTVDNKYQIAFQLYPKFASADRAYLVGMVGAGLGVAGIVLAVVLSRKNMSQ